MSKGVKFLILIGAIFLFVKVFEPSGPNRASAVGQYDANQPVIKYQAPTPYKCKTTSWDGPYKHDGRTYSTVCN